MKTQHTPGPWVFAFGSVYAGFSPETVEESAGRLLHADRDNPHTMPTERDANCRLAAAAPELMVALADCLRHIEIGEGHKANDFECVLAARAAIAKATGKV